MAQFRHRHDAATAIIWLNDADLAVTQKSVALHKFEQMRLDVRADAAVGLDDGGGRGIDLVPRPAELRVQPAPQRADPYSVLEEALDSLDENTRASIFWKKFGNDVRKAKLLANDVEALGGNDIPTPAAAKYVASIQRAAADMTEGDPASKGELLLAEMPWCVLDEWCYSRNEETQYQRPSCRDHHPS